MPFSHADLGALFQGDGFTLWHYRTADTRAAVAADGYIAPMAGSMLPGDHAEADLVAEADAGRQAGRSTSHLCRSRVTKPAGYDPRGPK